MDVLECLWTIIGGDEGILEQPRRNGEICDGGRSRSGGSDSEGNDTADPISQEVVDLTGETSPSASDGPTARYQSVASVDSSAPPALSNSDQAIFPHELIEVEV